MRFVLAGAKVDINLHKNQMSFYWFINASLCMHRKVKVAVFNGLVSEKKAIIFFCLLTRVFSAPKKSLQKTDPGKKIKCVCDGRRKRDDVHTGWRQA